MRLAVGIALALTLATAGCGGGAPTAAVTPRGSATPSSSPVPSPSSTANQDPCGRVPGGTSVTLPVGGFGRILDDPHHCQVFISSPTSNTVVVVDFSGRILAAIPDEYGAGAMAIDGSNLYVALTTTGAIDEIDTQTLTRVKTVVTGLVKPRDLAFAGGRLWTTTGECAQWSMQLVGIDPTTGKVTPVVADRATNLSYCAGFATSATNGNVLVAWDSGLEPGSLTVFDVSGAKPVVLISKREEILGNLIDAAITPRGDKLVTASGSPYEFDEWTLATASQDGVIYPGSPYPNSVAISPVRNGLVVTGLILHDGDSVSEYELGKPAPVARMLNVGSNHNLLYARGLTFSEDGSLIFAVTGMAFDGSTPSVTLNILPGPNLP